MGDIPTFRCSKDTTNSFVQAFLVVVQPLGLLKMTNSSAGLEETLQTFEL